MTTGDWIITLTGALVAAGALTLLAWSLLSDRLRTRPARRAGTLRRCPRCWYDLSAVAGLRCPECGREAKRERSLTRSRRRWRIAAAALLFLAIGAGTIAYPQGKGGLWHRWVPSTALILWIGHAPEPGWAADELARRLGWRATAPHALTGRELGSGQWNLLADACAHAIERSPSPAARPSLYWLALFASPLPEKAFTRFEEALHDESTRTRLDTAMTLDRARFFLSDAQLVQARNAIRAQPEMTGFDEEQRQWHIQAMDRQLLSRAGGWDERRDAVAAMPLTPDSIMLALDGRSVNDLIALHRRLRLPRSMLVDADENHAAGLGARRFDLKLDDDDLDDCIVLVWNRAWQQGESSVHYEAFALRRSESGWRFLGYLDQSNCLLGPPQYTSLQGKDGKRRLVVRRDAGVNTDGSYFIMQDAWYRVRGDRLVLEQAVMPRAFSSSRFHQTLEPSEPRVIRRSGRYLASYDIESTISLAVPGADGSQRLVPIAAQRGTFEYPLGVPDIKLGQHVAPGPWQGRDCWWAILEDPQILVVYKPEILALARSNDPDVRAALRAVIDNYLSFLSPTPELSEIQAALDEP